jgi:hypothetical protein
MPIFVTSKFSFKCKCDKSDLDDVKSAIEGGKAYVSLKHEDSLISTYIYPAECYKGKLEILISGLEVTVIADFSAKTKMTPKAHKEISASTTHKWTTDGLCVPGMSLSITGHDEIEVPVTISDKK